MESKKIANVRGAYQTVKGKSQLKQSCSCFRILVPSDDEQVLYTPVRALFDSLPIDFISQWWCPAESDEKNPSQFFDHLSKWWWNKHVNVPTRQKCLEMHIYIYTNTVISNLNSFGSIGLKPNYQYREVESINLKVMGYLNWLVSINYPRPRIKLPPPEILHGYPKITI